MSMAILMDGGGIMYPHTAVNIHEPPPNKSHCVRDEQSYGSAISATAGRAVSICSRTAALKEVMKLDMYLARLKTVSNGIMVYLIASGWMTCTIATFDTLWEYITTPTPRPSTSDCSSPPPPCSPARPSSRRSGLPRILGRSSPVSSSPLR